jgi:lysophospholipase L1-like esterase
MLTLGDSMAFGWDPLLQSDPHQVIPSNYRGYGEEIASRLGYIDDNGSCPGEASGSFVSSTDEDNGSRQNRADYGTKDAWDSYAPAGGHFDTQLQFVEAYLQSNIAAGTPPKMITLSIGGNDLLLVQKRCQGVPGPFAMACELPVLLAFENGYREHLANIFSSVADTGYVGPIAVVTTYVPDYSDQLSNLGVSRFNDALKQSADDANAKHPGLAVVVADAYAAFKTYADQYGGKTCETGLLIKKPDGTCDIHPSPQGHDVIASTILQVLPN